MNLTASECYTASDNADTYCYCIKREHLLSQLDTFPDSRILFLCRAQARRVEMRRIKYTFMTDAKIPFNQNPQRFENANCDQYTVHTYSAQKRKPDFLTDMNHYFSFSAYSRHINKALLEDISDSEQQKISTQEDIESQLNNKSI